MYFSGTPQRSLAASFDVSTSTVSRIVRGEFYRELTADLHLRPRRRNYRKITDAEAILIRRAVRDGMTKAAVARRFGVSAATIHRIVNELSHRGIFHVVQ